MSDPDLSPQLDRLEALLDAVEAQVGAFEERLGTADRTIDGLAALAPTLDLLLALAAAARSPDPATYEALAKSLFEPLQTKLSEAEEALDISFLPAAALDGLTEEVRGKLGEIDTFATDAASVFAEDVSELSDVMTEGIPERLREGADDWQAKSEEAEAAVTAAASDFEAFRENAAKEVEEQLKERLLDLLGKELTEVSAKINEVFGQAEEVLNRIEGLVSDGVGEVTSATEKVLQVQRAIRDLRPLMEILV